LTGNVTGSPRTRRRAGLEIGRHHFRLEAKRHDGIVPGGDPATLGASLVVWGLDPASVTTIDLDPSRWKTLRKKGEVVGYRYRDRSRSRGGVSKVVLRNGRLEIHARGPRWTQHPDAAAGGVWVRLSVGEQNWCGVFANDARQPR